MAAVSTVRRGLLRARCSRRHAEEWIWHDGHTGWEAISLGTEGLIGKLEIAFGLLLI